MSEMDEDLLEYLRKQRLHPLPSTFVDVNKTGQVRKALEYGGVQYRGSEDLLDYKDGKVTLKIQRQYLNMECDQITAPCSKMKQWQTEGKVLVHGATWEDGPFDVYDFGAGVRGYIPWPQPRPDWQYDGGSLPASRWDDLWLPIRFSSRVPLVYFQYRLYQRAEIRGQEKSWNSGPVIDLGARDEAHRAMVSASY
jgi:hypothetical protein